jgi:4,5-dihydroxyphthalate decarboxylase
MSIAHLSLALGKYEHVRDLLTGEITVPGVDLVAMSPPVEEIFYRFFHRREWDISEFSLAKYTSLVASGDTSMVGLPIFPSRLFRHSSAYVRRDSDLSSFGDFAGLRVGVPEWAQTASVYTRGILSEGYGIDLGDITWVQAGVNEPGRREKVTIRLPPGVTCASVDDRSLNEMLLSGDLDAVLSARPPRGFTDGTSRLRRLLRDPGVEERRQLATTGVFPIMHVVVLRRDVHDHHPWLAENLMVAFEAAKRASFQRLEDITCSQLPIPWVHEHILAVRELFDGDPFPYGIEPNRRTLETFTRLAHQQGVAVRHLAPEELFGDVTDDRVRV